MTAFFKNKLAHNFFSLGFVQAINSFLQLLVIPYLIARIGVANFGVIGVAQVVVYYMSTFTDFGFNQTASREVSLNKDNRVLLSSVFSRVYVIKLILCVTAFAVLLLLSFFFSFIRDNFRLYCMAFVFVMGYAMMPGWFLQGTEQMKLLAVLNLLSRVLAVGLVVLIIKGPAETEFFIFFFGIGNLICGIAGVLMVMRFYHIKFRVPSSGEIGQELRKGAAVTVTNLSMNIVQYGNLFILRLFTNDLVAGYFSVAERVYFTMKQVLTIFAQVIYPRVCQLAENAPSQLSSFFKKVFTGFFLAVLAGSAVVFIFAPALLDFFVKDVSAVSVYILRVLCIILPVVCLNIPSTLSLLAFDRRHTYFAIYTSAMLLNTAANILFVRYWEEKGTLVSIALTEIFITAGVLIASSRYRERHVKSTGHINLEQ